MAKTVEEIYQKKTPKEHILLRPDTYIGSVERESQNMYVWDESTNKIVNKNISFVPGLYKIFDEIIVNAADNKIRDPSMSTIKVNIDQETNTISVFNDGKGVPIEIHKDENVYVPELIFGQLLTSSNYDDKEKKVTGGRNGYGAKLCNIFSTEFIVETADLNVQRYYKQVYQRNMDITGKPEISRYNKKEFTRITFKPDLKRFKMEKLDDEIVSVFKKRVYDLSGIVRNVKVYLNDVLINVKKFEDYVRLYLPNEAPVVYERINDRWEVAFTTSEDQFQQVSFVNSISTSKGGSHVNHVVDQITESLLEHLKKKHKDMHVKPFQVKASMFIFINSLIDNPAFDSQTKENLTLRPSSFGSKCEPLTKFIQNIIKNTPIIENVANFVKAKENLQLKKTDGAKKKNVIVPKLDDAKLAGSKRSNECILILTEGDSAKTMVMAGRSCVGGDILGVFSLKGKLLNVREANNKQILENKEITAIKQILGLQQGKTYTETSSLRYGHVMIMTDQDFDGSHIKGLLINFFDYFFPSLLKIPGFLQEFITPIVRGRNNQGEVFDFFTIPEYEEFKKTHPNYTYKYYKGLGTSTSDDAIDYFSNLDKHVKNFKAMTTEDQELIDLAFNKKKADMRKNWLLSFEPGTFLDQSAKNISISDFVNKELILFSMADNIRSIPNVIDGMKPAQRKILFTCFKKNLEKETKVTQLSGYVTATATYNHGEASLHSTIISLAHDFVGSNNINLLMPVGQFGSRLKGGKDSAAPRYINTKLNPLTRLIFHKHDDLVVKYIDDEDTKLEPEYYVPIIPMVLINGADGIGTGWSTNIPDYNPKDVIRNLRKLIRDEPLDEMKPFYRNFIGNITKLDNGRYQIDGVYQETNNELHITELPIGVWSSVYKEYLDDLLKNGDIEGYSDCNTDKTVNITIQLRKTKKSLKLNTVISTNNMICFDPNCKIKRYNTPEDIIKEFYYIRLRFYMSRKEKLLEILRENMLKLENKVKFIREVVNDTLKISKRKRSAIIEELKRKNYEEFDEYKYLLSMEILSLTEERIDKLNKEYEESRDQYNYLLNRSPKELWLEDLDILEAEYDKVVEEEEALYEAARNGYTKGSVNKKRRTRKQTTPKETTTKVKETVKTVIETSGNKRVVKKSTIEKNAVTTKKAKIMKIESSPEPVRDSIRKSMVLTDDSSEEGEKAWEKY